MAFNDFQKAALAVYADGDYRDLTTMEDMLGVDDTMLHYIVRELEDVEGCDDAMERINTSINDLTGVFQELLKLRSYKKIEFLGDPDEVLNGWWIVSYDPDGTSYDSVGAYDSYQQALEIFVATGGDKSELRD